MDRKEAPGRLFQRPRKRQLLTAAALSATMAFPAQGQVVQCESIIASYRVVHSQFSNESDFKQHASNFCDEYSKTTSATSSRTAAASYNFLSASIGRSNANRDELASRFCSAEEGSKAKARVFRSYKEMVSPEAFDAYELCKRYAKDNGPTVVPYVDQDKGGMSFSIKHDSQRPATFQGVVSTSFSCSAENRIVDHTGVDGQPMELSSAALNIDCKRKGIPCEAGTGDSRCSRRFPEGTRAYTHYPSDTMRLNLSSGQQNISFPAFDDGAVIVEFERLESSLEEAQAALESLESTLNDVVRAGILEYLRETGSSRLQSAAKRELPGPMKPGDWPWGEWTGKEMCGVNEYVCGLEQRVQGHIGDGDDGAMQRARFWCCPLLSPSME